MPDQQDISRYSENAAHRATANGTIQPVDQRRLVRLELVDQYIALIQEEHDRWSAFREQAMNRQQYLTVARYGDVCDALEMAIHQARKILLPNVKVSDRPS